MIDLTILPPITDWFDLSPNKMIDLTFLLPFTLKQNDCFDLSLTFYI